MNNGFEYITYHFFYNTPDHFKYRLEFSSLDWEITPSDEKEIVPWAELGFHQCQHCPLNDQEKLCPLAKQLAHLSIALPNFDLDLEAVLRVETRARIYEKRAPVGFGLQSLLWLIYASSNCPHLHFFKPMARFHLPFATEEENLFRVFASFALFNSMSKSTGLMYKLQDLKEIYQNLHIINKAMYARIEAGAEQGATVNALLLLDSLSQSMISSIDGVFDKIQNYFVAINTLEKESSLR